MSKIIATILAIFFIGSPALASGTRLTDGDALISSDHTKTWTGPGSAGTLMVSAGLIQEVPSGTVNGSNVTFTLANTPGTAGSVILKMNGIELIQGGGQDYTISGATITMATAPALGQKLYASYSKF